MAEDKAKQKEEKKTAEDQKNASGKKSGLIKYIIFGLVGLVAVVGIAFGTLMFLGNDKPHDASVEEDQQQSNSESNDHGDQLKKLHASKDSHQGKNHEENQEQKDIDGVSDSEEDSILALIEQDESFLDNLMANLEVLDYVPDESELGVIDENSGMSKEDSVAAMNWLEKEKATLIKRQEELDARQKSLNAIEAKVSKQIIRIEQAESNRIAQLAKLYDGMETRSIAKLMANLDDETVVAIIPRMKLKNASSVLSLMPSQRAARLSKQMITIAEK